LLSQVENGKALPSLPTLGKIVEALGVSLSEFFSIEETEDLHEKDIIVRKNSRKTVSVPDTNSNYQILTPNMDSNLEFFICEFPPREDKGEPVPSIHDGEEYFYVVRGPIRLCVGDNTYDLEQGDSGSFDAHIPHGFSNSGDDTGKVLFAATGKHAR